MLPEVSVEIDKNECAVVVNEELEEVRRSRCPSSLRVSVVCKSSMYKMTTRGSTKAAYPPSHYLIKTIGEALSGKISYFPRELRRL